MHLSFCKPLLFTQRRSKLPSKAIDGTGGVLRPLCAHRDVTISKRALTNHGRKIGRHPDEPVFRLLQKHEHLGDERLLFMSF